MKQFRWTTWISIIAVTALAASSFAQDDSLGKGKGRGKGSGGSGSGNSSGSGSGGGRQTPPPAPPVNRDRDTTTKSGNGQQTNGRNGDSSLGGGTQRITNTRNSRSSYGTQNNQTSRGNTKPIEIPDAPLFRGQGNTSLRGQVLRQENTRPNYNNYRNGYYHYDRGWCDDFWGYSHYSFSYNNNCAVSPWYNYSYMPGYVDCGRINWDRVVINVFVDVIRDWNYRDRYDRNSDYYYLDNSVADLVRIWERNDQRALGRMIPGRGYVTVSFDNNYRYSLSGRDFYDMFSDAISTSRTTDYRVIDVRAGRDGTRVIAEHQYRDPWNRKSCMYHTYTLGYNDYFDNGYYYDDSDRRQIDDVSDDYFQDYRGNGATGVTPSRVNQQNNRRDYNDRRMCIISFSSSPNRPRF